MKDAQVSLRAKELFSTGFNCAEAVLLAVAEYFDIQSPMLPRVATAFGGGGAGTQGTCGALTGGLMAIGALLGRDAPTQDRTRAETPAKAFIGWFADRAGCTDCRGVSGCDFKDPQQHAAFRAPGGGRGAVCVPLVMEAAEKLCEILEQAIQGP